MTRKDFVLIANVIRAYNFTDPQDRVNFAYRMADSLRGTNPHFDRQRFIATATK